MKTCSKEQRFPLRWECKKTCPKRQLGLISRSKSLLSLSSFRDKVHDPDNSRIRLLSIFVNLCMARRCLHSKILESGMLKVCPVHGCSIDSLYFRNTAGQKGESEFPLFLQLLLIDTCHLSAQAQGTILAAWLDELKPLGFHLISSKA